MFFIGCVPNLGTCSGNGASVMQVSASALALDSAQRDGILATNAATLHNAPSRRSERGVDVLGSGFGSPHGVGRFKSWTWRVETLAINPKSTSKVTSSAL